MAKPKPIVYPPRTVWDLINEDAVLDGVPPPDLTGVVYPKRAKPDKRVDPYDLEQLPTRVLLVYLDAARASGDGGYCPTSHGTGELIPIERIKEVLATREHVHNTRSGSEARRKLAQQNHGSKRRKAT